MVTRVASATRGDMVLDAADVASATADRTESPDIAHLCVGILALLALSAGAVGWLMGFSSAMGIGLTLFALVGLGASPLQLSRSVNGLRFLAYGLAMSVTIVLLTGCLLVEFRLWGAGVPLFIAYTLAAFPCHIAGIKRHASSWSQIRYSLRDACLLYTSPSPRDRTRSRM